jgi:HK97 gp10 family phage protein
MATVYGVEKLMRKFQQLDRRVARKLAREAAKAGQEPVREAARSKAPIDTGKLEGQIRIRVGGRGRPGTTVAKVGVFTKKRGEVARWVEFGKYDAAKGGLYVAPQPFLRPAFHENRVKSIEAVKRTIAAGLQR